jgi:hypothetical protein
MHQLIASYLFQNKACPLPGLGTLLVTKTPASPDFLNKLITGPQQSIIFENAESDASNLLDYIALKTNTTVLKTIENLGHFCSNLKRAALANNPATVDGVGNFFTDAAGKIDFKPQAVAPFFQPAVKATWVTHTEAEHPVLVGDKETTSTVMTEYFSDTEEETPVKKDRWWVWAIVLAAIALLALLFYANGAGISSMVGNVTPVQ